MSIYIELDDAIEHINQLYHGDEVEAWLESLPTIEVSEDCISREEMLDTYAELYDVFDDYPNIIEELHKVYDKLNGLSNAISRAEGEWIPCSERLPREYSDDERVLATTDVDGLGVILIPAYDVKSWYRKGYITAWMPLPEPWKGADNES